MTASKPSSISEAGPPQGIRAIQIVNPRRIIPIHYDDYDVFKSPLLDFQAAVKAAGLEDRATYVDRGGTFPLTPPGESVQ